jgi:hypothetical protein
MGKKRTSSFWQMAWLEPTAHRGALSSHYLMLVAHSRSEPLPVIVSILLLTLTGPGRAQGLPEFAPTNPMSSSRSGLYFQPFREPVPGRWTAELAVDYASLIEYNRLTTADYVLDSEILRSSLELGRDFSPRMFATLTVSLGGAYAGFMDGFLDWYHGALGIKVSERDHRPRDQFLYAIRPPSGPTLVRSPDRLFLNDLRLGLGLRYGRAIQSVLSLTLPTSTGPSGYGRGILSLGLLNTFQARLNHRLLFEGSFGAGFTPTHGDLREYQRELFATVSSGMRLRLWGRQSIYGNLFYHSPYYHETTLPGLDLRELSLDFGWILGSERGSEWRLGLTEDLEPGGPGVDLVIRLGRKF